MAKPYPTRWIVKESIKRYVIHPMRTCMPDWSNIRSSILLSVRSNSMSLNYLVLNHFGFINNVTTLLGGKALHSHCSCRTFTKIKILLCTEIDLKFHMNSWTNRVSNTRVTCFGYHLCWSITNLIQRDNRQARRRQLIRLCHNSQLIPYCLKFRQKITINLINK